MTLTLIKEDGTGLADANSYASVADGDEYHDGHLYATAWTAAVANQKAAALIMATRLIDAEFQFGGVRAIYAQALQWPRSDCREPDGGTAEFGASNVAQAQAHAVLVPDAEMIVLLNANWTVPGDIIPKAVVEATCELARELLLVDRTASPAGEGLKYQNNGSVQTGYDKTDTRPIIPAVVQAMLGKYGSLVSSKSGAVRLVRT